MERKDWTLLVLAAAGGERLTPVQLQKTLFLLEKRLPEVREGSYYRFTPYHYGPFDSNVYADARELSNEGLVTVAQSGQGRWSEYAATPAAISAADAVKRELPEYMSSYVTTLVDWVKKQSFEDLLRSVYNEFPDMKVNSVFRG